MKGVEIVELILVILGILAGFYAAIRADAVWAGIGIALVGAAVAAMLLF